MVRIHYSIDKNQLTEVHYSSNGNSLHNYCEVSICGQGNLRSTYHVTTDITECPTDYPISQEISEALISQIGTPVTQEESSVSQPSHLNIPEPTKLKQPFEPLPTDFSIPKFVKKTKLQQPCS